MIQPKRPLALLTSVLRGESGQSRRALGLGGTVGSSGWAYSMTQFDAEQYARGMRCPRGHSLVADAAPIRLVSDPRSF